MPDFGKAAYDLAKKSAAPFDVSQLAGGGKALPKNDRLHLATDQAWIKAEGHKSDLIRLQWLDRAPGSGGAKPALVWCDEKGNDKAAIIAHYKANDPSRIDHRHISIETTMSPTGANPDELFTRFELPFDADVCEIQTHDSNFTVVDGKTRIMGGAATNRGLTFGQANSKEVLANQLPDGSPDYNKVFQGRFEIRVDNSAESGGNAGSDFRIVRFNDAGVAQDAPFFIKRSNAYIGLGTTTPTAPLDVSGNTIRLRTKKTPASATAAGNEGDICWDADYLYVCVAPNIWKRMALAAW
ncbi:hypothetical protein D3C72_728370 [compost metagenome]